MKRLIEQATGVERVLLEAARRHRGSSAEARARLLERAAPLLAVQAPTPQGVPQGVPPTAGSPAVPWSALTTATCAALLGAIGGGLAVHYAHTCPTPTVTYVQSAAPSASSPNESPSPPPVASWTSPTTPMPDKTSASAFPASKGPVAVAPPQVSSSDPQDPAPAIESSAPAAAPSPPDNGLSAEVALIDTARRAVAEGRTSDARQALVAHQLRFPNGRLALEAGVLRAETLLKLGEVDQARALARRLMATNPSGPYRQRLERVVQPSKP